MELLGDPQRSYPVIHVAGTNGKTSTARMIESLLGAMGLRTGLFTSPHLVDPRERVCFDGQPIEAERLLETWREIEPYVAVVDANSIADGGVPLSYFEVLTGLAFAAFADAPVDVAIVEVGLGGGWDSTNVVNAAVCVITPIGLDHMDYLGDTIELIAREKAGIMRSQTPVVIAEQEPEALQVLLEESATVGAVPILQGIDFGIVTREVAVGGQLVGIRTPRGTVEEAFLPLFGEHQARNAAVALATVEEFLAGVEGIDSDLVRAGFAAANSPGRLQVLRRSPTIIVDVAHNPHGAHALSEAVQDSFAFAALVGVVGVLAGKDALGILMELEPLLTAVVICAPHSRRAMPADDLAALAREVFGDSRVSVATSVSDAIDMAATIAEQQADYAGAGVLITGSVVLVGQAMTVLEREGTS
jgi:dihydrofolate synthase/folylpolyglutamate synthase